MGKQVFQFPPNGKAHANTTTTPIRLLQVAEVSIPSKREGTCERIRNIA